MMYKQRCNDGFSPLSNVDYKLVVDRRFEADYSKCVIDRGGRRANRFRNQMDILHPDEPCKYGLCHQPNHNRRNCSNSQPIFNAM
ncbi:hypothetical protein LXL04_027436 [Taraxacum kok-saghyz]